MTNKALDFFYKREYSLAKEIFENEGLTYEAGVCALLLRDLKGARKFFEVKKDLCAASEFGLIIIDIIEDKTPASPKFFQVRTFLEVFINFFIENELFDWGQKIIDSYEFFTRANLEVPKFIARVLNANGYNNFVHRFAKLAKEICFYDAEIHYIEADVYINEGNYEEAKQAIIDCKSFAKEYFPILKLENKLKELTSK